MLRTLAGHLAVGLLNLLGRLPVGAVLALGTALLPLYLPFRPRTRRMLRRLRPPVRALAYYRMRLRLALLSVKHALDRRDGCTTIVEGGEWYRAALAAGRPVVLLGWHQGPVELLHRIPAGARDPARPFLVVTASAFSGPLTRWMARGRARTGITVLRPGDERALREWIRARGVLAVMIDQVPGAPEDRILAAEGLSVPWPRRLLEWLRAHDPLFLCVSVHWEPGDRILFRYDPLEAARIGKDIKDEVGKIMRAAIARAPEQYNWSYPKMRGQPAADSEQGVV